MKKRMYTSGLGMIVAMACGICLSEKLSAQGSSKTGFSRATSSATVTISESSAGNEGQDDFKRLEKLLRPESGFKRKPGARVSGSRSVSFMNNGKRVAVRENASGISVSVDGKTVRATNADELKEKHPEEFRLYAQHIGAAQTRASAGGFSSGSGGSGGGRIGAPMQFNNRSLKNRSISVVENGKKISINEDDTGITVAVNGKRVKAKNAEELKKKSPEAFEVYNKLVRGTNAQKGHSNATLLLQEELSKLRDENADNPRLRSLIDRMIENAGN